MMSEAKDGIYLFEEFLNVSLSDSYYNEYDSYQLWRNAWDNEINMYEILFLEVIVTPKKIRKMCNLKGTSKRLWLTLRGTS